MSPQPVQRAAGKWPGRHAGAAGQARSLRQDYLLFLRDMGLAAIVLLPLWELLRLGRTLLIH